MTSTEKGEKSFSEIKTKERDFITKI